MTELHNKLVLRVIPKYDGAVGYGDIFRCTVTKKLEGELDESFIDLVILAGDKSKIAFTNSHLDNEIEIVFRKKNENEPYALMPLCGFVDKNNTSWEVEELKSLK